jgi:hypothetical protein
MVLLAKEEPLSEGEWALWCCLVYKPAFAQAWLRTREGREIELWWFQIPWLLDDRAVVACGREVGKSQTLVIEACYHKVNSPDGQLMITSWDQKHTEPRFREVVDAFRRDELLSAWIMPEGGIRHAPYMEFRSINNHRLYGVIPGVDGGGYEQYHVNAILVDEGQRISQTQYTKMVHTLLPPMAGVARYEKWFGVFRGSRTSPFERKALDDPKLTNHVYRVPSWCSPMYSLARHREYIEEYGGSINTNEFKHMVLADPGDPMTDVFSMDDVAYCMTVEAKKYYRVDVITKHNYRNPPSYLCGRVLVPPRGEFEKYALAVDTATSGQGEILVFGRKGDVDHLIYRVRFAGVADTTKYEEVIDYLADLFDAWLIAIDRGYVGTAIESALKSRPEYEGKYEARLLGIDFQGKAPVEGKGRISEWAIQEIQRKLAKREFGLPKDIYVVNQFLEFSTQRRRHFHFIACLIAFVAGLRLKSEDEGDQTLAPPLTGSDLGFFPSILPKTTLFTG